VVTISIGICTLVPNNDLTPENFIEMADKALYHSKEDGRDRSTCYDDIKEN
jgi:PleD family two-component response regulator